MADLLDLARLDAHRFSLDLTDVAPTDVLDRAFDAMEAEATTRGLAYERGIEDLPTVVTDESRVQRIVSNLLDNAIHWTPRGGTVRLEARGRPEGGFTAEVSDTGPGIPAVASRSASSRPSSRRRRPTGGAAAASAWRSAASWRARWAATCGWRAARAAAAASCSRCRRGARRGAEAYRPSDAPTPAAPRGNRRRRGHAR